MPIGKNAIKRVENNGYSNVKTEAPDMENSTVIAKPDAQVAEKLIAPVEKATEKKKRGRPKKSEAEKTVKKAAPVAKKTAPKKAEKPAKKDGFARVSFGEDMPYYLL